MGSRKRRDSSSHFFKSTKPTSSTAASPLPDPTPSKRKAPTSAPSSTPIRPKRKRPILALPSLNFTAAQAIKPISTAQVPLSSLVPEETAVLPTTPSLFSQTYDEEPNSDLGSASNRSISISSQSTNSLASHRSSSGASVAPARDAVDVKRVLNTIKKVKDRTYRVKKGGPGGKYLIQRTLHYSGYKLLWEELKKEENQELLDYVDGDDFRFDYLRRPCKGDKQFVIHMPSSFREDMAGQFSDVIREWLFEVKRGEHCNLEGTKESTKMVAMKIRSSLATRVKCSAPLDDQLEPDLSFTFRNCRVADRLVEVAWSQSNLKLSDRAKRYIEGKSGQIRTIIGLNMNDIYRGGCGATFSTWKAQLVGDRWRRVATIDNQEFLDEHGQAVKGCTLPLSLKDFVCEEEERELEDFEDVPLEIPATKLYDLYKLAFEQHVMGEAGEQMDKVTKQANEALENLDPYGAKYGA